MIFYIKMKYLIEKNVNNKNFLAELTFCCIKYVRQRVLIHAPNSILWRRGARPAGHELVRLLQERCQNVKVATLWLMFLHYSHRLVEKPLGFRRSVLGVITAVPM